MTAKIYRLPRSRDGAVTRVRDTRVARLAALDAVPIAYRAEIVELLRALAEADATAVESAVDALALLRARALDNSSDHYKQLVTSIIEHADRDLDLVRASLTVPKDRHDDLAPCIRAYADEIADRGAQNGAVLVVDLRPRDHAPHAYGVISAPKSDRTWLADRWCKATHADRHAIRLQTIGGWPTYARQGDESALRGHLTRVVHYGLKDLPDGLVRDLDRGAAASGRLAGPWSAFCEAEAVAGRPPPVSRLYPIGVAVTRACAVCGTELVGGRADRVTCSDRCRTRRGRDRRRGG